MPGSFDLNDLYAALSEPATPVSVFRYDDSGPEDDSRFAALPNVVCEQIDWREGAEVPTARFRYLLDELATSEGWPTQFDDLWPLDAAGPFVVRPDDRIVVLAWTPEGDRRVLFDGFAQVPQADLSGRGQSVTFVAVHVATRCWDLPISGRVQRHADDPEEGEDLTIDLPCRFNPSLQDRQVYPNCTPESYDVDQDDPSTAYPIFLDERIERDPDPRRAWTLSGAVRYLLSVHNTDHRFVLNPDFADLDDLLKTRYPREGSHFYDPEDPLTYASAEIVLRDYDATNKPWPIAVGELLSYSGFGMRFETSEDSDGLPRTDLVIYRLDAGGAAAPKAFWLDEEGADIDPARNNVGTMHLARDMNKIVNAFAVETPVRKMELCVVLAPGFEPAAGDEAGTRSQFAKKQLGNATAIVKRKYRLYVADEAGEGHFDATWAVGTPLDLNGVFEPDDAGDQTYVVRRRPGSNRLLSKDSLGHRRKAMLHYSLDYAGLTPAVWDGTGTWKEIVEGWNVLDDRLGIEVTCADPESWAGSIRGVTWLANPPAGVRFTLRLTTVIDDDIMLAATAPPRTASPTQYGRWRRVDARDHFELQQVHPSSPFGTAGQLVTIRDDTDKALAHARALRAAHEFPTLAGSVTMPGLTNAYKVGDRVRTIRGREVSLQVSAGAEQGEARSYPCIVGVSWSFAGDGQSTTLQIADRREEVQRA